jgi:Sec-independent protein translocase protein TatA
MFPFGIGTSEILMIFFVTFIVLGPSKIPEIARMFGKGIRYLREITDDVKNSPEFQEIKNEVYQPIKNFNPKKEMEGFINQSLAIDTGHQPSTSLDPHQPSTSLDPHQPSTSLDPHQPESQLPIQSHDTSTSSPKLEDGDEENEEIIPRLSPMDRLLVEAELKEQQQTPQQTPQVPIDSTTKDS